MLRRAVPLSLVVLLLTSLSLAQQPIAPGRWLVVGPAENDLARLLAESEPRASRFDRVDQALAAAPREAAILVLADGYPERPTRIDPVLMEQAAAKKLRLYLEYPDRLPGLELGPPKPAGPQRGLFLFPRRHCHPPPPGCQPSSEGTAAPKR